MSSMERLCCSEWMGSPISMVYIAASTMTKRSLYAFDILALGGDGLRKLPLQLRKTNLDRLLARRADGIHLRPIRTGRDWSGPIQGCLQHDAGGPSLKAPR